MKSITLTLFGCFVLLAITFGQAKTVDKVIIKTPAAQCELCKTRIEQYMSREPGISAIKVDIKMKTTTVTYLTDRNNIEQIKTALANLGFDADDVTAEEDAIRRLPPCCKKPVAKADSIAPAGSKKN